MSEKREVEDYMIVEAENAESLTALVRVRLGDGWAPLGRAAQREIVQPSTAFGVAGIRTSGRFYQTLVKYALAAMLLLGSPAAAQDDQMAKWAGAVTVGWDTGNPEPAVAYALTDWPSVFGERWGAGEIVGLLDEQGMALGVGHRFRGYETDSGAELRLALGVCWWVDREGEGGLRGGEERVFVSVSLRRRRERVGP